MAGQRNTAFALLWISQALSQLGTSISSLAYPLMVLQESGSALDAGLVGAVVAATALILRVPGGMIADRHRHRSLMLFADAMRSAIVAGVAASVAFGFYSLPLLLVAAALEVAFGVVFGPAEFALVRLVVVGAAAPLAPALIGGVIDAWDPGAGIWGCAAAFAVLTVLAFLLPAFRRGPAGQSMR